MRFILVRLKHAGVVIQKCLNTCTREVTVTSFCCTAVTAAMLV